MKKSKKVSVRTCWSSDPRPQPVAPGVSIALLVATGFALVASFVIMKGKLAHGSTPNLIMTPKYSDSKTDTSESEENPKADLKYQYEPASAETPVLHKKAKKEEDSGGAEYAAGDELVIEPDSGDLAVSLAPVVEDNTQNKASESAPSSPQSPSTTVQKIE